MKKSSIICVYVNFGSPYEVNCVLIKYYTYSKMWIDNQLIVALSKYKWSSTGNGFERME